MVADSHLYKISDYVGAVFRPRRSFDGKHLLVRNNILVARNNVLYRSTVCGNPNAEVNGRKLCICIARPAEVQLCRVLRRIDFAVLDVNAYLQRVRAVFHAPIRGCGIVHNSARMLEVAFRRARLDICDGRRLCRNFDSACGHNKLRLTVGYRKTFVICKQFGKLIAKVNVNGKLYRFALCRDGLVGLNAYMLVLSHSYRIFAVFNEQCRYGYILRGHSKGGLA